jgi:cysteinyl-tRNA synthetase
MNAKMSRLGVLITAILTILMTLGITVFQNRRSDNKEFINNVNSQLIQTIKRPEFNEYKEQIKQQFTNKADNSSIAIISVKLDALNEKSDQQWKLLDEIRKLHIHAKIILKDTSLKSITPLLAIPFAVINNNNLICNQDKLILLVRKDL